MGGILESFLAGKEARRVADAAEQINAMSAFIGQNGAAIMGGDANALGQLAGFGQQGLQMAMGIQGDVQQRERQATLDAQAAEDRAYNRGRDKITDQRADQKWEMDLAEYKKGLTAEQAAAEAAKIEEVVKMGLMVQTPEDWDAMVTQGGAPDLVGQFDNREAIAARYMSIAEVLKQTNPEPGKPLTEAAQLKADLDAGRIDQATYETEMARRAPKGSKISFDPATGAMTIEEGVGVGGTPMTVDQGKNTGFILRMDESNKTLNELEDQGTSLWNKTAGKIPVVGNYMVSEESQKYDQAKRDFINAVLRRESGAVISPEEFANAEQQYFPQPGDGPEVVAQKKRNREVTMEGIRVSAGPGGSSAPASVSGSPSDTPAPAPAGSVNFEDAWSKY